MTKKELDKQLADLTRLGIRRGEQGNSENVQKGATKKIPKWFFWALGILLAVLVLLTGIIANLTGLEDNAGLGEATRKRIFYWMVDLQDEHPYDNDWQAKVKELAVERFAVSMKTINEIIREGAMEAWPTPPPP